MLCTITLWKLESDKYPTFNDVYVLNRYSGLKNVNKGKRQ